MVVLYRELDGKLRQDQLGAHLQQKIRSALEIGVPLQNLLQLLFTELELPRVSRFPGVQVKLPLPEVLAEDDGRHQEKQQDAARDRT